MRRSERGVSSWKMKYLASAQPQRCRSWLAGSWATPHEACGDSEGARCGAAAAHGACELNECGALPPSLSIFTSFSHSPLTPENLTRCGVSMPDHCMLLNTWLTATANAQEGDRPDPSRSRVHRTPPN